MADLAVGLAKSVIAGTLSKAQSAIEEEAKFRKSAQRDLVFITGEFQMMQSFLNVANEERLSNPVVRTWVVQIRELAYDVEDCIEFVVHLDKKESIWIGLWRMLPSCMAPSRNLDKAVDEIEQLKARVEDVSSRNARYSLINDSGSKPATVQQELAPRAAASAGAAGLDLLVAARNTGRSQQRDLTDVMAIARNDAGLQLQVISVWGTGGDLGLSSIIWNAYNDADVCQNYTRRAWVKLIHPFNPREFVRSLAAQFLLSNTCHEQKESIIAADDVLMMMEDTHGNSLEEFVRQVNEERYLVVLEDLGTMAEWEAIRKFFPKRKNGSCIIVTTLQLEVASLSVGDSFQVLDLNQFSSEHCLYAFFNASDRDDGRETDKTSTSKNKLLLAAPHSNKKVAAERWLQHNSLIGRDSELNHLRQCVADALLGSIQVMSVWGIAGVGKSYLVKNMFCQRILMRRNITQEFCWVDVSHPFNLQDFSRSLFLSLNSDSLQAEGTAYDNMGGKNLIAECRHILRSRRCLVVIDGVQSTKEWELIQTEFVLGSHDISLFIVITNEASIAKRCRGEKGEFVFNVKVLEAEAAFNLFIKEVSEKNSFLGSLSHGHVVELRELVSKCGGLAKVIVGIARSLKNQKVDLMRTVRSINHKFMQDLQSNVKFESLRDLFGGLHDSYFRTCPDDLKPCVFYLSIFPRDHIIRRRRLVRRWVAEGYARDDHEESGEENGEKHFTDLLDLSIIQQPSALYPGDMRMVFCRFNCFVRDCIVSRRTEENIVFELSGACALTTQRSGRHLVIQENWYRDRIVFESTDFSRLRSLTVFGKWQSFFISESMKLLRVLDLEDASGLKDDDLENIVKHLQRLKFLSLRGCRDICCLPSSLGDLKQLQTLDVRHTSIVTLPRSITKLHKLQYIRAGTRVPRPVPSWLPELICKRRHRVGVTVPRGIGELKVLHTLGVVDASASGWEAFLEELSKLTQLRKIGVSGINKKNIKMFFDAISGHLHLETLSVQFDKSKGRLDDGMLLSLKLENLRSLKLYGLGVKLPVWTERLSKLSKVHLEMTTLVEGDIQRLGKLPKLCSLSIRAEQLEDLDFRLMFDEEVHYYFHKIKILQIACSSRFSLPVVTFGQAAMKNLELLKVDCCSGGAYQFCGLEHLHQLKEIVLVKGPHQIHETMQLDLMTQLVDHPNKPVVKLEDPRSF